MKNVQNKVPSVLLLIVLVGFPQISESIFTPVLPALSQAFRVSAATSQLAMSFYFIGFAGGVLLWGWLSDRRGRRVAMCWGIVVYALGNLGLLLAPNVTWFLVARLVQAFGAATGSVVTQTIMRESFQGVRGAQVFAQVSAAMALSPALGPIIGGALQTYSGHYQSVFVALVCMASVLLVLTWRRLPETRGLAASASTVPWYHVLWRLVCSPQVWLAGSLISGINGILFSYYAEAPFIFQTHFGFSAVQYGSLGLVLAGASVLGAWLTNQLSVKVAPAQLIRWGLWLAGGGALEMVAFAHVWPALVGGIFVTFCGLNLALPVVLQRALLGFEAVIGTASGLFSGGYYVAISGLTLLMSLWHDGTVTALPRYTLLVIGAMLLSDYLGAKAKNAA
ncbi:multidrug effflux MFS transporter [Loigolactobacillus bifermentans]|uniref:Major facilitator superfamily permease n=1 Tax=Loigolactobacillus bifermentans DSM 20003 TaxID=1423726 RepID=A0A0R1H203_9LACO|nr:multidrug effflux MFS transporter [Loigolactobacillus bifermentans]KRK40512.1 major facilitator superfamily permease [Loigolactobacillus bifermentans DSM 20003]QGG61186.1 MFS transporter [Loigolactobacillus bifermentans]